MAETRTTLRVGRVGRSPEAVQRRVATERGDAMHAALAVWRRGGVAVWRRWPRRTLLPRDQHEREARHEQLNGAYEQRRLHRHRHRPEIVEREAARRAAQPLAQVGPEGRGASEEAAGPRRARWGRLVGPSVCLSVWLSGSPPGSVYTTKLSSRVSPARSPAPPSESRRRRGRGEGGVAAATTTTTGGRGGQRWRRTVACR